MPAPPYFRESRRAQTLTFGLFVLAVALFHLSLCLLTPAAMLFPKPPSLQIMENTVLLDHYSHVDHYSHDGKVDRAKMEGEPPLWAKFRPALREVLREYHANDQRSIWTYEGKLHAILLGNDPGPGGFDDGQITASLSLPHTRSSSKLLTSLDHSPRK